MSVSEKLANQAVLGSDMFAGLHGADRHYFMNLPVQHFLQAIVFRLVSPGVAEARAGSLILAMALVWMVGWLAYRWIGLAYSVTTGVLLGSQRWWWALRDHDYRSLSGVWQLWTVRSRAGDQPLFLEELAPAGAHLIVDNDIRADLERTPVDLQDQVRRALANDAVRVGVFEDRTYGVIRLTH